MTILKSEMSSALVTFIDPVKLIGNTGIVFVVGEARNDAAVQRYGAATEELV